MVSGTIFDISRYCIHDGPGIRTTVFFKGCPLSCWWCHNPEGISREPHLALRPGRCTRCGCCVEACPNDAIVLSGDGAATDPALCRMCFECAAVCPSGAREVVGRTATVDEVMAEIVKDVPFYDESGGGVTFSGGEPLFQPDFLLELLRACGRRDIHRLVETSGYAHPDVLRRIAAETDIFFYDLKHMDSAVHRQYTGAGNELILENLRSLAEDGAGVCVRLPLIPGVNDGRDHIEAVGAFLKSLRRVPRVDLLPYHDVMNSKYRRFGWTCRMGEIRPHDRATLAELARLLGAFGLDVTIGGNHRERQDSQAQASQP